jgi:RimK family alpha-L-glutamate ligase
MKDILFINLPKTFKIEFKSHIESCGYNFYYTKFSEISILNNKIILKNQNIENFDYIFVGLIEKYKYVSPILTNYLLNKNTPFIFYGHKPSYIDSKSFEIYNLASNNLPIISSLISNDYDAIKNFVDEYKFPIITKPIDGRKGKGVTKHSSIDSILDAVQKSEIPLIIQPMIPNDGDYRVWILKGKVIGVIKRKPSIEGEFRSNISLGGNAEIANLPEEVLNMAIKSVKILDLDMAGVDIIQDIETKKYYIMEVNAAPQFKGFMATTGINLFEVITKYIIQEIEAKN